MKTESKMPTLRFEANLAEMYEYFKKHQPAEKFETPVTKTGDYVRQVIRAVGLIRVDDDVQEEARKNIARNLFQKMTLKEGSEFYMQMFNKLSKLPGAKNYHAALKDFDNWQYELRYDALLETEIDGEVLSNKRKDRRVLEAMIKKYDNMLDENTFDK